MTISMVWAFFLLIVGFVFLVKGADFLITGSVAVAHRFDVSDIAIGLTVVAFGTSLPEFVVNIAASAQGSSGIAVGNVLGSNIANILLILGTSAVIAPVAVPSQSMAREIPFSLLAVLVLWIEANDPLLNSADSAVLSRSDGLVFLCFFGVFLFYTAVAARNGIGVDTAAGPREDERISKAVLSVVAGLIGLYLGGKWIVDSAVRLAEAAGVSQEFVGLSIVAVGTSLPELAASVTAMLKKRGNLAVGNVIGSNIFNIFFVLGASSVVRPLPFTAASNVDILVVVFSTLALLGCLFADKKKELKRIHGIIFLIFYVSYLLFRYIRLEA